MVISPHLLDSVIAHALRETPNECCGLIAVRDGVAFAVSELENIHASPFRFEMDGQAQLRAMTEIEGSGAEVGAIYHSHTRSPPYPSPTDINMAAWWPELEWLIVGTSGAEPEVRSYLIEGKEGKVTEVELA
jgi:proteasome lid subunit RPN8/RPN11